MKITPMEPHKREMMPEEEEKLHTDYPRDGAQREQYYR
jgi:hypothetical protein